MRTTRPNKWNLPKNVKLSEVPELRGGRTKIAYQCRFACLAPSFSLGYFDEKKEHKKVEVQDEECKKYNLKNSGEELARVAYFINIRKE